MGNPMRSGRRGVIATMFAPGILIGVKIRSGGKPLLEMDIAAGIVLALLVLLPAVLVGGLFVWAARKDGQEDRAVRARLGIRRRTRLGR